MPATRSDNPSQEGGNNLASLWAFGQHLAALLSGLMIESALLLALWALHGLDRLGTISSGTVILFPSRPASSSMLI